MSDANAKVETKNDDHAESPTVLCADDSRLMRHALKKMLRGDFKVVEASDGAEAWKKIQDHPEIQLVFTDLSMPEVDGFGLLGMIRGAHDARIKELPVVVITGAEDDEAIRNKAVICGATDFITKPFESSQILTRASLHTTHQKQLQQARDTNTSDAITGLHNQRSFTQRGIEQLSYAIRHKNDLALILMQLNDFDKICAVQDTSIVHDLLRSIGNILQDQSRSEDNGGYLGDGKFSLLIPGTNPVGAKHFGQRIIKEIRETHLASGIKTGAVSVSIGIAVPDAKPGLNFEDLIESAEQRLSEAALSHSDCLSYGAEGKIVNFGEASKRRAHTDRQDASSAPEPTPDAPHVDANSTSSTVASQAQETASAVNDEQARIDALRRQSRERAREKARALADEIETKKAAREKLVQAAQQRSTQQQPAATSNDTKASQQPTPTTCPQSQPQHEQVHMETPAGDTPRSLTQDEETAQIRTALRERKLRAELDALAALWPPLPKLLSTFLPLVRTANKLFNMDLGLTIEALELYKDRP